MKQFCKHTAQILCFVAGLLAIVIAIEPFLTPKDNTEVAGVLSERAYGFLTEPENSLDVLVFGDSEGYRAFIPLQIWEEYGITSYICCTSGQQMYQTEKILTAALENQKPKYVFLETNMLYRHAKYTDILKEKLYDLLPTLRYHDHWKHLTKADFTGEVNYTHREAFKGYAYHGNTVAAENLDHMKADKGETKISSYSLKMLDELHEICEENGVELVLISTPSTKNWNTKRHNHVEKLADEKGITYIDMNLYTDEIDIDWSSDTFDGGDHMNYSGAVKCTHYLGEYLYETGNLADHRSDADLAEEWNADLAEFKRYIASKQETQT